MFAKRTFAILKIHSKKAYPLRLDYYVLLHPTTTELIMQLNDGSYNESVHSGKFSHFTFDPISLILYAYEENKQIVSIFDLSTPSNVTCFREVKVPPAKSLAFSVELNLLLLQENFSKNVKFIRNN